MVAEMEDLRWMIQSIYEEALADASENFQRAEKNTTGDGGDVMYMSRDIADVTEDTVRHDLSEVYNGNNVAAKSYIPLSKTTPFALRYITGYRKDLPIIVDKKKAYFDMREIGKFKEDSNHHYHGMGIDGFINAMGILTDPEYAIREQMNNGSEHFAFISTNEDGEEVCVVFQMGVTKPPNQMNGYPGGYYNLDITEFVATDEWLEERGVEPGTSYKDFLLSFPGNSIAYDRSIHREQMEKARTIDSESAGLAASYDNNRASNDMIPQEERTVKSEHHGENEKVNKKFSGRDTAYIDAVNRGDMETAQKMVDQAAKDAGYTIKAYHGTTNQQEKSSWNTKTRTWDAEYSRFTVFQRQDPEQAGHFFNSDMDNAGGYGSYLYSVYLMLKKPLVIDCKGQNYASISFDGKEMDTYEWAAYAKVVLSEERYMGKPAIVFTGNHNG